MIGMSATCQIPLIAFYGRSGPMLHEIDRRRGSVSPAGRIHWTGETPIPHKREWTGGTPIPQFERGMLCLGEGDIFRTIYSFYRLSKFFEFSIPTTGLVLSLTTRFLIHLVPASLLVDIFGCLLE